MPKPNYKKEKRLTPVIGDLELDNLNIIMKETGLTETEIIRRLLRNFKKTKNVGWETRVP